MTQVAAVAIAAFFLGIGMASEPFDPLHAVIAGAILLAGTLLIGRRASVLTTFLFGFVGVLLTCYLQHHEIYPGTGVVAFGLGALAASSFGRRLAPPLIAGVGATLGVALFFLLVD